MVRALRMNPYEKEVEPRLSEEDIKRGWTVAVIDGHRRVLPPPNYDFSRDLDPEPDSEPKP